MWFVHSKPHGVTFCPEKKEQEKPPALAHLPIRETWVPVIAPMKI